MRDIVRFAEFVGENISADAVFCFERSWRVIEAGVNHAAIARAGAHANFWHGFEDEDVLPAGGEGACDGAADYACTDDDDICLLHRLIIAKNYWSGGNFGDGVAFAFVDAWIGCELADVRRGSPRAQQASAPTRKMQQRRTGKRSAIACALVIAAYRVEISGALD